MFTHIVLIKLKDRRPESIAATRAHLERMRLAIETLRELEIGVDVTRSGRSYDLALVTRFDDRTGYEVYREHSAHQPVLAHMADAAESAVAVDFES